MFEKLIQAAGQFGEPDSVKLAETLWLAMRMGPPQAKPVQPPAAPPAERAMPQDEPLPESAIDDAPELEATLQPDAQGKSPLSAGDPSNPANNTSIGALPSLPNKPRYRQALAPFASHGPQRSDEIDETETAEMFASRGGLWLQAIPQKGMRRWLKVCLVVETGGSNAIWTQPLAELEQLLRLRGVFRQVSRKTLGPEAEQYQWRKDEIIIVASDFTSDGWWTGAYPRLLRTWANTQAVVCMHTLPARLWRRSWAGKPDAIVCALRPAQETRRWQVTLDKEAFEFEKPRARLAVPIMEMDACGFASCAKSMMAVNGKGSSAIVLAARDDGMVAQEQTNQQRSPEQIVLAFKSTASPLARKLAQYFSVTAPLNFPIMRLVQQAMLPESDASHLAEFFLGGLLEQVAGTEDTPADGVLYDFFGETRDLLIPGLRISHKLRILDIVGRYLEAYNQNSQGWKFKIEVKNKLADNEPNAFALVSPEYIKEFNPFSLKKKNKKENQNIPLAKKWEIAEQNLQIWKNSLPESNTHPHDVEFKKNNAFTKIYEALLDETYALIEKMDFQFHNKEIASDVATEVFLSTLNSRFSLLKPIRLDAEQSLRITLSKQILWKLHSIARIERDESKHKSTFDENFSHAGAYETIDPEEYVLLREKIYLVEETIATKFSNSEQLILSLLRQGYSQADGAKILGISLVAYKSRLRYTIKKLRELI